MTRPGETPPPRAGADAPFGATAALQRLDQAAPKDRRAQTPATGQPQANPTQPGQEQQQQPAPDVSGGYDTALFAGTDRPTEPVTSGAAFGPGPNYVPQPYESDRAFALRVASQLEQSGTASKLTGYIEKLRWGS